MEEKSPDHPRLADSGPAGREECPLRGRAERTAFPRNAVRAAHPHYPRPRADEGGNPRRRAATAYYGETTPRPEASGKTALFPRTEKKPPKARRFTAGANGGRALEAKTRALSRPGIVLMKSFGASYLFQRQNAPGPVNTFFLFISNK